MRTTEKVLLSLPPLSPLPLLTHTEIALPDTVLKVLDINSLRCRKSLFSSRYHYHTHFTDEESEAQGR